MTALLVMAALALMIFLAYWTGYGSRDLQVRRLRQELHRAHRLNDSLAAANVEAQIDLALAHMEAA